jgi:hypothetical protein
MKRGAGPNVTNPDIGINKDTGEIAVPREGGGWSGTGEFIDEFPRGN